MRRAHPQKPLSPKAIADLNAKFRRMPYIDRICTLTASIVANDSEAVAATLGLAELIWRVSQQMSTEKRLRLADRLRDVADRLDKIVTDDEAPHVVRVEVVASRE